MTVHKNIEHHVFIIFLLYSMISNYIFGYNSIRRCIDKLHHKCSTIHMNVREIYMNANVIRMNTNVIRMNASAIRIRMNASTIHRDLLSSILFDSICPHSIQIFAEMCMCTARSE